MYELFPSDKYLPKPVDECLQIYFTTTYYARTRELICMTRHIGNEELLRSWAESFNIFLITEGKPEKTLNEYAEHFPRWLKFQDLNSNPKDLFNVKATSKTYTAATGNSDKKGAAYDAIDRLFGNKT